MKEPILGTATEITKCQEMIIAPRKKVTVSLMITFSES